MNKFETPQSRIGSNCTKWDRYQSRYDLDDVIALWVADMDFECPDCVSEAIIKRAKHPIYGYTDPSNNCIESIINWEKRHHQIDIKKEEIVFTTGVVYAIYTAIETFLKENDKVMVMTPVYPPFFNIPTTLNHDVVYTPLLENGDMNLELMENQLKNDSTIKMIIFCNPHNPTGKSWRKDELEKMLEIADKYDLLVVSDEIHADLCFKPHTSMLAVNQKYNHRILLLAAPTKTFNLAGMKISYALICNQTLCNKFAASAKASGLSSINIFGFEAISAAYDHGDEWLETCLNYIYENMKWLKEFLNESLPKCKFEIPEATYLAWVDFSEYHLPDNFAEILKFEGHVELQDGRGFKDSDGYQRINCACPRSTLIEGMKRVVKCMKDKGWY